MAMISPSALPSLRHDGGLYRELDVLARLQASLPDEYEIFHGVNWHSVHEGQDRHGEIDIVTIENFLGDRNLDALLARIERQQESHHGN